MLQDPRVQHHFEDADPRTLRQHQIHFLATYALGGPQLYKGSKLKKAHRGLNITDEDYEVAIRHLNRSLSRFDVPLEIRVKIEAFLRGVKPHIVYK